MLLDTPSLYFRAFHGVPESVRAPDGAPVNAVRGLLDFLARLIRDHRPTRMVAAFDADWRPPWRVAAIGSYKTHRLSPEGGETVPDTLSPQVPVIEEVLDAVGLARIGVAGYEADDVIGTLAVAARVPVDIVTGGCGRARARVTSDRDVASGSAPPSSARAKASARRRVCGDWITGAASLQVCALPDVCDKGYSGHTCLPIGTTRHTGRELRAAPRNPPFGRGQADARAGARAAPRGSPVEVRWQ